MTWAPDYCTVAEAKSYLRIGDAADDVLLGVWVTTASRAVDAYCGRQFGGAAGAETRTYQADYDPHLACWVAQIDDLYDDDITVIDSHAQVVTDFELGPINALQKGSVFTRIMLTGLSPAAAGQGAIPWWWTVQPAKLTTPVTVDSDSWGWPAVPAAVKAATLLQTARLAVRRDSPFGVAGSPSEGAEATLLTATLDPDLRTSLTALKRRWYAA